MHIKQTSIISSLIVSLILSTSLCAQDQDTATLKLNKETATNTFFDKSKSNKVRLDAIKRMGYPTEATFNRLISLAKDKSDDKDIRLAALKTHRYDEAYFNAALEILSDVTEPASLKAGLITDLGQRTTFRMPAEMRQKLQAALRLTLDDPDESVRLAAYRALVPAHDIIAIDKLVESLRKGTNFTIPLADGIELLDVDGSSKHLKTLRPFLNHSDPKVQAQASRALANDPESRNAVIALATNKQTNTNTRKNALRGLAREDQGFMNYAIKIILDVQESADIRYEAMKDGMGRLNYKHEPDTSQIRFAQAIERVASGRAARTSDGKELIAEAKLLLPHLQKNFPAIGRFYRLRK
jgi:hypothetical protein